MKKHAKKTRTRLRSRHANPRKLRRAPSPVVSGRSPSRPQPPLHAARTTHPPTGTAHPSQFSPTQVLAGETASALTPLPWLSPRDRPTHALPHLAPAPILLRFYSSNLPCRPRIPATERRPPHTPNHPRPWRSSAKGVIGLYRGSTQAVARERSRGDDGV